MVRLVALSGTVFVTFVVVFPAGRLSANHAVCGLSREDGIGHP